MASNRLPSLVPEQEPFQAVDEPNANILRDIVSPPNAVIESVPFSPCRSVPIAAYHPSIVAVHGMNHHGQRCKPCRRHMDPTRDRNKLVQRPSCLEGSREREYLPIDTMPMWCLGASDADAEEQANNMLVFLSSKQTVRSLPSPSPWNIQKLALVKMLIWSTVLHYPSHHLYRT